jgi:hypothetical protein
VCFGATLIVAPMGRIVSDTARVLSTNDRAAAQTNGRRRGR